MNVNNLLLTECHGLRQRYAVRPSAPTHVLANDNLLMGIEIELENFRDPGDYLGYVLDHGWTEHAEGSLVNGREFVMHPPRNGETALNSINRFFDSGFKYTASERTSIHVHVDMTDDITVGQFRSILALTYMLEGPIYRMADENRKWGSYSCPLTDMRPDRFNALFAEKDMGLLQVAMSGAYHEEKYYGCNVVSLRKHGTLEYRYFPCTTDKATLLKYVNLCLELKTAGSKFASPSDLCEETNTTDKVVAFIKRHLPMSSEYLLPYLDAADSVHRILSVDAITSDPNINKVPYAGVQPSPAIQRYLDAKKKDRKVSKQEKVLAHDQARLVDMMEMLRAQQRALAEGHPFIARNNAPVKPKKARPAAVVVDEAVFF